MRKLTHAEVIEKLQRIHGDMYDYSRITEGGRHQTVEVGCKVHGWVKTSLHNLLRGQGACLKCKGDRISKVKRKAARPTIEAAVAESRFPGISYDLDTFSTFLKPMRMVCEKHGEFWQIPFNHFKPTSLGGCPSCSAGRHSSIIEDELAKFVESLGVSVLRGRRDVIPPKEIDVWVPTKRVGFELHGLYYHADDPIRTRVKRELSEAAGVRLIQIFEDEWLENRGVVEDLIRASLGMREVVGARTLSVSNVASAETAAFFSKYHIQGDAKASIRVGLRDSDGELHACLTLARPRFVDNFDYEIVRFATSKHIPGAFEKLFKWVVTHTGANSITTYADLRVGTGAVYERAGFAVDGVTQPGYWWWKPKYPRIPRYQTQKHKLKSHEIFAPYYADTLSESDICRAAGFYQLYDAGHKRFVWYKRDA